MGSSAVEDRAASRCSSYQEQGTSLVATRSPGTGASSRRHQASALRICRDGAGSAPQGPTIGGRRRKGAAAVGGRDPTASSRPIWAAPRTCTTPCQLHSPWDELLGCRQRPGRGADLCSTCPLGDRGRQQQAARNQPDPTHLAKLRDELREPRSGHGAWAAALSFLCDCKQADGQGPTPRRRCPARQGVSADQLQAPAAGVQQARVPPVPALSHAVRHAHPARTHRLIASALAQMVQARGLCESAVKPERDGA